MNGPVGETNEPFEGRAFPNLCFPDHSRIPPAGRNSRWTLAARLIRPAFNQR